MQLGIKPKKFLLLTFLLSICPLFIGYMFYWSTSNIYFRTLVTPTYSLINDKWQQYLNFIPDLLWAFSLTNFIGLNLPQNLKFFFIIVFLLGFFISLIFEFLQFFRIFKGTFDVLDITLYALGGLLSIYTLKKCLGTVSVSEN